MVNTLSTGGIDASREKADVFAEDLATIGVGADTEEDEGVDAAAEVEGVDGESGISISMSAEPTYVCMYE